MGSGTLVMQLYENSKFSKPITKVSLWIFPCESQITLTNSHWTSSLFMEQEVKFYHYYTSASVRDYWLSVFIKCAKLKSQKTSQYFTNKLLTFLNNF